ncbi:MAG TPA: DUF4294 domain-containing protein [Chitinophagaceae bacterium]
MPRIKTYIRLLILASSIFIAGICYSQENPPPPNPNIPMPVLGPNDTIPVPAMLLNMEWLPTQNMEWVWVQAKLPAHLKKKKAEWTRLRNAVYVTYPYAKKAGAIMNDINRQLVNVTSTSKRKTIIRSKEKELKRDFTDPIKDLSVYQGKVLMKLINRQTGNDCYEIIKEYKGGVTARFWQTIAFVFGSNLKQAYDADGDDKEIEMIVLEVERMYR